MLKENESLLRQELEQHDDVLLVDSVEVYRNLSHKMMLFYKWATDNVAFNFTLKTDDDCYLDIDKILAALSDFNLRNRQKIWFSGFRTDWPVERHGKWREPEYTSSVYPAFACGAGNMLSADLVKWLAQNSGRLKHYQGEDVSLGIWLSAVGPTLVKDFNWQCMGDCDDNMYNSAQKAPAELREMWDNRVHCGNPCGCT
ncbi:predicted protein [Nematostella vectensis]|uniref:Hexosyltransferase n=2 Tax=Nematostella vectensis TaxID=45351 RepID=A7SL12_NEMVE|nr:predicted protein [Nematostella vectensis]|eukprot:XP_001627714.1 predicted protein [Nematostella vectensis]